ncbi:MAG: GNAT family N-acetyltransferase [Pirellulales bacterium]
MPTVDITVYYLEMLRHSQRVVAAPREALAVIQAKRPTVAFYRFLYNTVGQPYNWHSRGRLPDVELAALIQDPLNEVHVLYADGTPAGFAELVRRTPDEIELIQFGLMPEFIGQGLGKWLLQWAIDKAWSYGPRRLWLHTCTLDHPAALPNYLKAGFALYKQEAKQVVLADSMLANSIASQANPAQSTRLEPGRYRHYKGNDYLVLGIARHSETEEELVVYHQDYGDRSLWCRPKQMFEETVEVSGQRVPRFRLLG